MSLVQDHHHAHTSLQNTTEIQEAIALFRIWMRGELIFTGRKQNANKCARILPLFQNFVDKHASFFVDKFAYTPKGKAGQRGCMFALFRDDILPAALQMEHVRNDIEDASAAIQKQRRLIKRVRRNSGMTSVRCIEGWEIL